MNMTVRTDRGTKTSMSYHVFQAIHDFGPGRDMFVQYERNASCNHFHHDRYYRGNLSVVNGTTAPPLSAVERHSFDRPMASSVPPLDPETLRVGQATGNLKRKSTY